MKRTDTIAAIILLMLAGCGGGGMQSTDDLIIVDVTKSYPEKELILQDFMDVEYIPLETNDEFLTQGWVKTVGKEIILVTNRINDGDIFVYDRSGKALRKFNRKGEGGEEYLYINDIVLDEDNNEIFVNSQGAKKILVYDLFGKFKRSFNHLNDASYRNLFIYDKDNLICYDSNGVTGMDKGERGDKSYHAIISKKDGSITRTIYIPFKNNVPQRFERDGGVAVLASGNNAIIPYYDSWILVESSADTIFKYSPDGQLTPLIVRTPSIQSPDAEIFFFAENLCDRYYFMSTIKNEFNFETRRGFPGAGFVYDSQEKAIFDYIIYNDDYTNKMSVSINASVNNEIACWQILEAHRLVESYEKGELKGKLKEIAAGLDEEDNPVIMLIKYKK